MDSDILLNANQTNPRIDLDLIQEHTTKDIAITSFVWDVKNWYRR